MPWELTRPNGLYLLGLLAPLIGLYILRVRRTRQVVSSTWLWRTAARDLAASKPFQRLTPSVPLLLEGLAVVALALGLSGPRSRGEAGLGSRLVLVI
ncbi:MAG: BatA domain-containing protein, partial [Myxococcota bacterium]|nr:BatA domain-containing protein [Myxococcota bacterium]